MYFGSTNSVFADCDAGRLCYEKQNKLSSFKKYIRGFR